jgi:predicted RNase H-like HicB family nuclease
LGLAFLLDGFHRAHALGYFLAALTGLKMKMDKALTNSYPFTIRPLSEADGGGFAIEYPDLPGCISDGSTPEEASQHGCDAVKSYLLSCAKHGDAIPKPSEASGQWRNASLGAFTRAELTCFT